MDILNSIIGAVSKPSGMWASIINAFENGVGSYLLAIVLITLIVRLILIPLDTVNKKYNKKMTTAQAKLAPEVEKIKKQYANDPKLVNQKTQALYKKNGATVGGGCLIMLVFMALNLTIFFTLFGALNKFSSYKINQEYNILKDNYINVLNLTQQEYNNTATTLFDDYENVVVNISEDGTKLEAKQGDVIIAESDYKRDFSSYELSGQTVLAGDITNKIVGYNSIKDYQQIKVTEIIEEKEVIKYYYLQTSDIDISVPEVYQLLTDTESYNFISSDLQVQRWIRTYIEDDTEDTITYEGDVEFAEGIKYSDVFKTICNNYITTVYKAEQGDKGFLWIKNVWIADSPLKNSIFTYKDYKGAVGAKNVSAQEEVIYNSFMNDLRKNEGRVNGYFILAIISIGISMLSMWLTQRSTKIANPTQKKSNWIMLIILPLIMGIFAILYNSVFAIYLVVGQIITSAFTPLQNLIIKKWENAEDKRAERKKNQNTVDYRRK